MNARPIRKTRLFVTVGGQLPFPRLVQAVDAWAAEHPACEVFAQIGDSPKPPQHIIWQRFLSRDGFRRQLQAADVLVSHAGMGTILTAIELHRPIVVLPRRAHLGEHRNDHQWATVQRLPSSLGVQVARDEHELLARLRALHELPQPGEGHSPARRRLIEFLRTFVASG